MRESNDNIDHKNMFINLNWFCRWSKIFFFKSIVFFFSYENARNSPLNQLAFAFLKFILCSDISKTNPRALFTLRWCINHAFFHTLIPKFQLQFPKKYLKGWIRTVTNLHCIDDTYIVSAVLPLHLFHTFLCFFAQVVRCDPCYLVLQKVRIIPFCINIREVALFGIL